MRSPSLVKPTSSHDHMVEHIPQHSLPELVDIIEAIEQIEQTAAGRARVDVVAHIHCRGHEFPIHAIQLGSRDPQSPIIGFFGGVHGLERIGTHVVTSFMSTIIELLDWDHYIKTFLERARLVFMPLINPGGMFLKSRANPRGVDLMRNAPVEAPQITPFMLVAGHRISPRLPWYRGAMDEGMEVEAKALCDYVSKHFLGSRFALSVDVHSGFGIKDHLWFPYACSSKPFHHVAEVYALNNLLDQTYPNHIYALEPQANTYRTHGDIWDYLYFESLKQHPDRLFLPLTLELGSWNWVKKNPTQILSALGVFNPMIPHRYQRTLRRHLLLFDFLLRATIGYESWASLREKEAEILKKQALKKWYTY